MSLFAPVLLFMTGFTEALLLTTIVYFHSPNPSRVSFSMDVDQARKFANSIKILSTNCWETGNPALLR